MPGDTTNSTPVVVLSTLPVDKAADIARTLVEEQLAACVNLIPQVRSIYRWQGVIEDDAETLAVIKTTRERYDDLARRMREVHPYKVPEILQLPITTGHAPYLAWLIDNVR